MEGRENGRVTLKQDFLGGGGNFGSESWIIVYFGFRAAEASGSSCHHTRPTLNFFQQVSVFEETITGTVQEIWMFKSDALSQGI